VRFKERLWRYVEALAQLLNLKGGMGKQRFRRWLVVPFERTFADGAPGTILSDKLGAMLSDPAELGGGLNKALEALAAIRKRGLSESDSTSRATDQFRQATDPLGVWLDRKTILRHKFAFCKFVLSGL
jgi:phage/plasmid-associated DNA primase